jgi:CBS domain-containing membrane protein
VGLLTRGTLLAASTSVLDHLPAAESDRKLGTALIRDVMIRSPMTVEVGAHVSTAAHLMVTRKVGCLPVVDGSRLVGIVTRG